MARKPKRSPVISISQGNREGVLSRRDQLIKEHAHIVLPIARQVHENIPPSFDLADLIGVGNLALLKAATVYQPEEYGGCPFSAFARQKVKGAMLDSIRRRHWIANTGEPIEAAAALPASIAEKKVEIEDRETQIDRSRKLERLDEALKRLTRQQRRVIRRYYANYNEGPKAPSPDWGGGDVDQAREAYWRRKQSFWRQRVEVMHLHDQILKILREELAS